MAKTTYKALRRDIRALVRDVRRDSDTLQQESGAISEAARDAARVAEQIAAMKVAQATVAETHGLARVMAGLEQSAKGYAAAADTTAKQAAAAGQQLQTSHGGINEAVARSPQHAGNSAWYRQE